MATTGELDLHNQITLAFTSEIQRRSLENQLKVGGLNINSVVSQPRSSMYGNRSGSMDPRRDVNDECGFPLTSQINIQDLRYFWEREPVANRVVNILPRESWRVTPRVFETEDKDTNTEFEKALDELPSELSGQSWLGSQEDNEGNPLWSVLARLDELCGIGTFGVLLIGIDDGKELSEPIEGINKDGENTGGTGKRHKLTFLRAFDESAVAVKQYEEDKNCKRYKHPTIYTIDLSAEYSKELVASQGTSNQEGIKEVHWTRVIHVADNIVSSDLFGIPRMIPVINNLMNLQKLYGGDAEIWWKNASRSMILETHPQLGGKVKYNSSTMKAELEKFNSGLQRDLITTGFNAKTLAPSAVDPSKHVDIQIDAICVQLETPKRIFLGSERGELASTQDADAWENRLKGRRNRQVTPRIVAPVLNRFILIGVLPAPGKFFYIAWDPLEFMTPLEKAQIFSARMDALTKYIGGEGFAMISPLSVLVRELGYTKEDAIKELESAEEAMEEADPPLAPKSDQQGENPFGGDTPPGEGGFDDTGFDKGMLPDERAGSTKSKRARFPYDRGKKLIEHHAQGEHDQKKHGNRPGGKKARVKLTPQQKRLVGLTGRSTEVYEDEDGWTCVKYHDTEVVRFKDTTVVLDSGGYRTRTTKSRMNGTSRAFNLGFHVFQMKGEWYVTDPTTGDDLIDFEDGMTLEVPPVEDPDWRPSEMTGEDMSYIFHHPGHPDQKPHGNWADRYLKKSESKPEWVGSGWHDELKSYFKPLKDRGEFVAISVKSGPDSLLDYTDRNSYSLYNRLAAEDAEVYEFIFGDDKRSTGITGRGQAKKIFTSVFGEFVAHLQETQADVTYFTASEPSRQKLYEFFTRMANKYLDGYTGFKVSDKAYMVTDDDTVTDTVSAIYNPLGENALWVEHHTPGGKPHPQKRHGDWADDEETEEERRARLRRERSARSKASHKPATKEIQDIAKAEQARIAKILGGDNTPDNLEFDVLFPGHGIEVKTIQDNEEERVNMHTPSRIRKEKYAKKHKIKSHVIAIDIRGGKRKYYYKKGVGAYRLKSMRVMTLAQLKQLFKPRR